MFEFFIAINSYNLLASRAIMKNPEDENLVHLTRRFDYYVDLNFWNGSFIKYFPPIRVSEMLWDEIKRGKGKEKEKKKGKELKNLKWFKGRFKAKAVCIASTWCYYSLARPSCLTSNLHARDVTGLYRERDSSDRIFETGRFRFVFFPLWEKERKYLRLLELGEEEEGSRNLVDTIRGKERKREISRIVEKEYSSVYNVGNIGEERQRERELKGNERDSSFLVVSGGEWCARTSGLEEINTTSVPAPSTIFPFLYVLSRPFYLQCFPQHWFSATVERYFEVRARDDVHSPRLSPPLFLFLSLLHLTFARHHTLLSFFPFFPSLPPVNQKNRIIRFIYPRFVCQQSTSREHFSILS